MCPSVRPSLSSNDGISLMQHRLYNQFFSLLCATSKDNVVDCISLSCWHYLDFTYSACLHLSIRKSRMVSCQTTAVVYQSFSHDKGNNIERMIIELLCHLQVVRYRQLQSRIGTSEQHQQQQQEEGAVYTLRRGTRPRYKCLKMMVLLIVVICLNIHKM